MLLWTLLACGPGGAVGSGSIDTAGLWPAVDGRFQVYRDLTASQYADDDESGTIDEENLVFSQYSAGGCGDGGWRVELRTGSAWESATAAGALLFDDSGGLAICGWEAADGTSESYDPPLALWEDGAGPRDGDTVASGDWNVTASRETDVATYFGIFPSAVDFTLAGSGGLDGWSLHLATGAGIVLIENDSFTADLVYTR